MQTLHLLQLDHPWLWYILLSVFAVSVGSSLNVIIYRLPIMINSAWNKLCYEHLGLPNPSEETDINLFLPRSFCPVCKKTIKAWQNIPLLSYFFLKKRCYHCKAPISYRYPLIEVLCTVLTLYASYHFGVTLAFFASLPFLWICLCLIAIDLQHQILPDELTLGLLWLGLLVNTQHLFTTLPDAVLSAICAYFILWLFIKLFYILTKKIGMGHGDFKLFAALGAWFGWKFLPFILFFSAFTGSIVGLGYLWHQKKGKETPIPFGPFLCIAGMVVLFWGESLLSFYWQQSLF